MIPVLPPLMSLAVLPLVMSLAVMSQMSLDVQQWVQRVFTSINRYLVSILYHAAEGVMLHL